MEIDGLYIVRTMLESDDSYEGKSEQGAMAVTTDREAVPECELWHFRLAHLCLDAVRKLSRAEKAILTLREVPRCVFTECVYGKMTHKPLPSVPESSRASRILEIIHSDIAGPIYLVSLGGSRYSLLFTDDFTRYKVGYAFKKQLDGLKCFKGYKA